MSIKNVVLAHDSLTQLGGAEKVVDVLHEMFPDAPLYVLVEDKKLKEKYKNWNIKTSWLQFFYNIYPRFQHMLPLVPWAVGGINVVQGIALLGPHDRIQQADGGVPHSSAWQEWGEGGLRYMLLSSSSGFAKGIKKPKNSIHINYCHTPTRFLWSDFEYVKQEVPLLLRPFAQVFLKWMKRWDKKAADGVDYFIANSKEVQGRIKKYYNRESVVVYPPIDFAFWSTGVSLRVQPKQSQGPGIAAVQQPLNLAMTPKKQDYFLLAGRLQAHKKNDLIIEIFNELGLPLHVVGTGRQEQYLKSIAKPNITFYGRVSDEELRKQYSEALGFIYPQIEDAGLMPLEAAGCGTATIGFAQGGSLETIIPGVTGELFHSYNKEEIKKIIINWDPSKYSLESLQSHARQFDKENFKQQILKFISTFN